MAVRVSRTALTWPHMLPAGFASELKPHCGAHLPRRARVAAAPPAHITLVHAHNGGEDHMNANTPPTLNRDLLPHTHIQRRRSGVLGPYVPASAEREDDQLWSTSWNDVPVDSILLARSTHAQAAGRESVSFELNLSQARPHSLSFHGNLTHLWDRSVHGLKMA